MVKLVSVNLDLTKKCVDVTTDVGAKASFGFGKKGAAMSLRESAEKERKRAADIIASAEMMEAAADVL